MKTSLSKNVQLTGFGYNRNDRSGSTNTSGVKASGIHPYQKKEFWTNPSNQFWNSDMYSEASKAYFIECLQK